MKQSKSIPRRVAGSLLYSLNCIAERLKTPIAYVDSTHSYLPRDLGEVNSKILNTTDATIVESVRAFWAALSKKSHRGGKIGEDAFMSIAKHSDMRVRYVAQGSSTGLVITTGCLERLLYLAANIVDQTNNDNLPKYVCEDTHRYSKVACPHFLRVLDILRYMRETGSSLLEISLENFHRDIEDLRSLSGYGYNNVPIDLGIKRMYPFISDRYQDKSWIHYLTTLYSGMCEDVNETTPTASLFTRNMALSELNIK